MKAKDAIPWGIAVIGGIYGAVTTWYEWGWTTPHQHDTDVGGFRVEWKCDEFSEEIADLIRIPQSLRTPEQNEELRRKQDFYDEKDCEQYAL